MDIANYLSELLDRHGKVGVPGLGYFTQVRVNGYYSDTEKQFYPPGNQIQFSPEPFEDDTLVKHIAEKKKISLASSKYFTEKYINGLKHELAIKEVPFANLGWFSVSQDQIVFKSNPNHKDDPEFYGFATVALRKLNDEADKPEEVLEQEPATLQENITEPEPVIEPEIIQVPAPEPVYNPPTEYDEPVPEENPHSSNTWLIVLLVIVVIALSAFGIYKYKPELFGLNRQVSKTDTVQPKAEPQTQPDSTIADTAKTVAQPLDTPSKAISRADTPLNKPVANTDTVAKPQYVIFAGSFKTLAKSELAVQNYKSIDIDARLLNGPGTGRLIKVVIGSFATYPEGEALRIKLVKSGKLRKDSYTQIINQKK
ncbi:hypothetical protein [Mucilaginibacter aquaedulcis]|uniref:HU domain-containing protein n=1 Tax=Mucilaginibacter aquaedulcis TaxID=1187081 RepID=UPI0025B3D4BB|nr:hypothetical protein [Mucilaginibacter aquaedulcis]MDN3549470.1 hypothetical protein [Mucilaginibacter aquaedulcis]